MVIIGNIIYLKKLIDIANNSDDETEHEIYFTELNDELRFIKEKIDYGQTILATRKCI